MNACAQRGDVAGCDAVLEEMRALGVRPNAVVLNSLLKCLRIRASKSKKGRGKAGAGGRSTSESESESESKRAAERALVVLSELEARKDADAISYGAAARAVAASGEGNGCASAVRAIFARAAAAGVALNTIVFGALVTAARREAESLPLESRDPESFCSLLDECRGLGLCVG